VLALGLAEEAWGRIVPHTIGYAIHRGTELRFTNGRALLAKGYEAKDCAFEAIKKVLTGERACRYRTEKKIEKHIMNVIKSLTSHLVNSPDNTRRQSQQSDGDDLSPLLEVQSAVPLPDQLLLALDLTQEMRKCLSDDPFLDILLTAIILGERPREIARRTRRSRKAVNCAIRKIRRRLVAAGILTLPRSRRTHRAKEA